MKLTTPIMAHQVRASDKQIDTTHLTPTLACSDVAKLKQCSVRLIRKEVATVPGAYFNGSGWQIPREAINKPPLSELPRKRGRKKAEPQ